MLCACAMYMWRDTLQRVLSLARARERGSISDFFGLFSLRFLLFSTWLCSFSDISCTTMTVATLFLSRASLVPVPSNLTHNFECPSASYAPQSSSSMLLWPLLIIDVLLWVAVMPLIVVPVWCVMRLCVRLACQPVPVFLDTPWELLQSWYLVFHCIKVVDADGANTWRLPDVRNIEGCVLTNHRSWGDFVIDPAMAFAPVVARTTAVVATMLAGAVGLACGKVVMINRGKTSRQQLKERCATLKRYMFYPEGTRS